MREYLNLLADVLANGTESENRTNTSTIKVFGRSMRFDLRRGFPLVTTKKIHFKSVVVELLWFLKGYSTLGYLHKHDVKIWNQWATENGDLGPIYGEQWRCWPTFHGCIDQLSNAIDTIKTNPNSRRIIVSAWNPEFLPIAQLSPQENVKIGNMALAPCHAFFQFAVTEIDAVKYLDLALYQRSVDVFLGLPFNIASYSLLLEIVAKETGCIAREFVWFGGDTHLYTNHIEQARIQLEREPYELPRVEIADKSWKKLEFEDFTLVGYNSHPHIKGEISV